MARTQQKRKRGVSDSSGDTFTVARPPSRKTVRGNIANIATLGRRIAGHVKGAHRKSKRLIHRELTIQGPALQPNPPTPKQAKSRAYNQSSSKSHAPPPPPPQITAPSGSTSTLLTCCYHCRTRGGQAAYHCVFEPGKLLCTRCISDKRRKCRVPTAEEARAIAARCPQCTRRGFKACNGGTPCDTCVRNKTVERCRQQPVKTKQPANQLQPAVSFDLVKAPETVGRRRVLSLSPAEHAALEELIKTSLQEILLRQQPLSLAFEELQVSRMDVYGPTQSASSESPTKPAASSEPEQTQPPTLASSVAALELAGPDVEDIQQPLFSQGSRPRRSCGRVSYVEPTVDEDFGRQLPDFDDDESDVYVSSVSDASSISAPESIDELDHSSRDEHQADEVNKAHDIDQPKRSRRKPQPANASARKSKLTWDFSNPPLNTIEEIFADLTANAMELGLRVSLKKLNGSPIRVATMFSGTESPIIALEMIANTLEEGGAPAFKVEHLFSAEINPVKQGYIERNFAPPILFRDVREFIPDDATSATTAYGAVVEIPGTVDILIAGFVCKDLSLMNNKRKSIHDDGETGDTWRAVYNYAKRYRPKIVLIENIFDTKEYYLPQTRMRMYMIAADSKAFGNRTTKVVADWKEYMLSLKRACSTPFEAFLKGTAAESGNNVIVPPSKSEPAWVACKLRYDRIRSEEQLGPRRPVTKWSENGTLRPPEFGNHQWFHSRSTRELECIDVVHNQRAHLEYDTRYKMEVWDVSQSVDRYHSSLGIVGCITPNGCDFVTNQQSVLTGCQMLRLQGMPNHKLLFGRETQKDLQDLAGNAMSSTVIGASLISALIAGVQSFKKMVTKTIPTSATLVETALVTSKSTKSYVLRPEKVPKINMIQLMRDASLSSRLCACEKTDVCKASVKVCEACGHTACSQHAGNPAHVYSNVVAVSDRIPPHEFIQKWRGQFPARLRLSGFPDIRDLVSKAIVNNNLVKDFMQRIREADIKSQRFVPVSFERQESSWSIKYVSSEATLKVKIMGTVELKLYIRSPSDLRGDDPLRTLLEQPVGRAVVSTADSFEAEWEIFIPHITTSTMYIQVSTEMTGSWKSRLGLPAYKTETTPLNLVFTSNDEKAKEMTGEYRLLPTCGTACDSLYKKSDSNPPIFFYLDPDLVGHPSLDSFVFTHDLSRRVYAESRISLGRLDPTWRPWNLKAGSECTVQLAIPGFWVPVNLALESAALPIEALVATAPVSLSSCARAITILDLKLPENVLANQDSKLSWLFSQVKGLPAFSEWQSVTAGATSHDECTCAPSLPPLLWEVDTDGTATAHEEPKLAAAFERAQKTRPPIFIVESSGSSNTTRARLGLNIASLIHRAQGRLPTSTSAVCKTAWRLRTDHAITNTARFPKFTLQCNARDTTSKGTLKLEYDLDSAQLKSLAWMKRQETGRTITITEAEEAVESDLGLRAEAQAQYSCTIRGGVLADRPSFGKTVTTIALVQSEFERTAPEALLKYNQSAATAANLDIRGPSLQDLAATLIVCPPHIARQWQSEFNKFLGSRQYELYNIQLVENFAQLRNLAFADFEAARVIILSWSVFSDMEYISQLARFAAIPEPGTSSGNGYNAWLDKIVELLPAQLDALGSLAGDYAQFKEDAKELLQERLSQPEFQVAMPIKLGHGSAYHSFNSMQSQKKLLKGKGKGKSMPKSHPEPTHAVPFPHLFRFNRLVVDEYHYLLDDKPKSGENYPAYAAVKSMTAVKRWVLSGTPALTNFSDVNEIASFLGVKLGRTVCGDGFTVTPFEKKHLDGQTAVKKFLSRTEIMSPQWHRARHDRAQRFLDCFVRKNRPALDNIVCKEVLQPISLDLAHHAVYLELSQHLTAQRMQLRKPVSKSKADRVDRLNDILDNSATAEDALLKSALLFETAGDSGIDTLMQQRSKQRSDLESEILRVLVGFESRTNKEKDDINRHYTSFKDYATTDHELGDGETSDRLSQLLAQAFQKARRGPKTLREVDDLSGEPLTKELKNLMSKLRELARELVLSIRSQRFIEAIKNLTPALLSSETQGHNHKCSATRCPKNSSLDQLRLITECGHIACESCLTSRDSEETCVYSACNSIISTGDLIKVTDLGKPAKRHAGNSQGFGNKLKTVVQLIKNIPNDEQGVVFVPNQETIPILAHVLDSSNISYHALSGNKKPSAKKAVAELIEDFKNNTSPCEKKKVLVLNLGCESAAGINLTNANHMFFISPLLTKSQYEFDSAMAQAIARIRRYGQKKSVHIHHFAALNTIDVDIVEQRHRRKGALRVAGSRGDVDLGSDSGKKERTKMIRNANGEMMLIPVSWVTDGQMKKRLGVDGDTGKFTSLICFSDEFEEDED
ncbi:hypothetical protein BCR34DRAFT_648635 [Clohesyomyces aquaticus]|uniref:Ig-like domain-containing protein n=1 Tax=Clohesyomyces aquaticus TaxID=1231657 RepID=A0A1Y1ZUY8_9PLEO|nr:hypothetical protein BCR34DRAFT_648635 [Clohesyomyces aquaticus]